MGTLLYTVLSDADRLGVLNIPHPMANRRVLLPKLAKRRPAVLDEAKLGTLFDRARNTRLYTFVILAAATGCRRGELLALQWSDLDFQTGLLDISKSLEQTRAGLRVKSTKSEEPRRVAVLSGHSRCSSNTGPSRRKIARCSAGITPTTISSSASLTENIIRQIEQALASRS
jgi:hypothetical protein